METDEIERKIEEELRKLIPLFELVDAEKKKLQKPCIIRALASNDYPRQSRAIPGYDGLRNLFYFPAVAPVNLPIEETDFVYFASSYLHHQINPSIKKAALKSELGEASAGYYELREIVGEYPNIILGNRNITDNEKRLWCQQALHVFIDHGPGFLPELSRMSLEKAVKEGIVR